MEAVGVAASITGILAFAGQSLKGLGILIEFIQDSKDAPDKIKAAVRDFEDLLSVLETIQVVVGRLQDEPTTTSEAAGQIDKTTTLPNDELISMLYRTVQGCRDEIIKWSRKVLKSDVQMGSIFTVAFKRMKFAVVGKNDFNDLWRSMWSQRQVLTLLLTTLNTYLESKGIDSIHAIEGQLVGLTKTNLEINNTIIQVSDKATTRDKEWKGLTTEGLASVEARIKKVAEEQSDLISVTQRETHSLISSVDSSIATLATSVSRLAQQVAQLETHRRNLSRPELTIDRPNETKTPDSKNVPKSGTLSRAHSMHMDRQANRSSNTPVHIDRRSPAKYCCDRITGIDDAFRIDEIPGLERRMQCLYCWQYFEDLDPRTLGKHLVTSHRFGQCDADAGYANWKGFRAHLVEFHAAAYSEQESHRARKPFEIKKVPNSYQVLEGVGRPPLTTELSNPEPLIEAKLLMLLTTAGHFKPRVGTPSKAQGRLEIAQSLERLEKATNGAEQEPLELLCSAAFTEEDLVVHCDERLPYNWSEFNHDYIPGAQSNLAATARQTKQDRNGKYWMCLGPNTPDYVSYDMGVTTVDPCKSCSSGKIYSSWETAIHHYNVHQAREEDHAAMRKRYKIVGFPRPLSCWELLPEVYGSGTFQDRLNWWFSGVFVESDYTRTLLRSGAIFETGHAPPVSDSFSTNPGSPLFNLAPKRETTGWISHIDIVFQPTNFPWVNPDAEATGSDGAIDSRDSIRNEENSLYAESLPERDSVMVPVNESSVGNKEELGVSFTAVERVARLGPTHGRSEVENIEVVVEPVEKTSKWICVDAGRQHVDLSFPLGSCSACTKGWRYDDRAAAEAHLRRAHLRRFPPVGYNNNQTQKRRKKVRDRTLDSWVQQIEVEVGG